MSILNITINGKLYGPIDVEPGMPMINFLHEYVNLTGTKFGCGEGICHACVVIVDNDDGTYTLTPPADYYGSIQLNYQVTDGNGGSVAASNVIDIAKWHYENINFELPYELANGNVKL